jgi:hypothetical protein
MTALAPGVLLLASDALAAPQVWVETSVRVLDYTTPWWDGVVEGMFDEFNGMLPESARSWSIAACRSAPART